MPSKKNSKPKSKAVIKAVTRSEDNVEEQGLPIEITTESVGTNETQTEDTIERLKEKISKLNIELSKEQDDNLDLQLTIGKKTKKILILEDLLKTTKEVHKASKINWEDELNQQRNDVNMNHSSSSKRPAEKVSEVTGKRARFEENNDVKPAASDNIKQHIERKVIVKGKPIEPKPTNIVNIKSEGIYKLIKECKPDSSITLRHLHPINSLSVKSIIIKAMIFEMLDLNDRLSNDSKKTINNCDVAFDNYKNADKSEIRKIFRSIKAVINSEKKKAVIIPAVESPTKIGKLSFLADVSEDSESEEDDEKSDDSDNNEKPMDELAEGGDSLYSKENKNNVSESKSSEETGNQGIVKQENTQEDDELVAEGIQARADDLSDERVLGTEERNSKGISEVAKEDIDVSKFP